MFYFLTDTVHNVTHGAAHAASHAEHAHPEAVNWLKLLAETFAPSAFSDFLLQWERAIYSFIITGIIGVCAVAVARNIKIVPGRGQAMLEAVILGLDGLVCGVLGPQGRAYTPFIGSLFIYIFVSNMFGLFPLQGSSMGFLTTTVPLALSVFLYVQWIGITRNGPLGYLYHMAGSPKEIFGWVLVPLTFPLHVLGEFIKPLSLSFRLYGNIMAGHILLAVFLMLGVQMLAPLHVPAGVPLHLPFLFLEIMVGTIQAFVFTLLSTVYIAMMLPHDDRVEGAHA